MSDFPWLTILWLLPVAGALAVLAVPAERRTLARGLALVVSVGVLGVAAGLAVAFEPGGAQYQFVESRQWIPAFGAGYTLGLDGIALVLVVLTAALVPLLILAGWHDDREVGSGRRVAHTYVALTLLVEAMVLMSFLALDILLFYVFFEAMLIPMYFLIGGFGPRTGDLAARATRSRAAVKFLLYNLLGGLIMLAAVIGLYVLTARAGLGPDGGGTFDLRTVVAAANSGALGAGPAVLNALFLGFMFAFAVKAPLWPLHTWLPDAAVAATPSSAVLMMAVVDKVGTFGMLRFCLTLFPGASQTYAPLVITLAVIGILYGALLAIGQTDVMRLIAYTSISHFGFIILGIFAMTSQSQSGATLYMVNHGISTAALFLIAGFLVSRRGTRLIADYGGVQKVAPVLAGTFFVAGLATLSLPGLAPFVSEFLVLVGTFSRYQVAAVFATGALVLAAIYVLWLYQRMMTGPVKAGNEKLPDLVPRELLVVAPLIAGLVFLGVYPKAVLDVVDPAVGQTLTTIGRQDPAPTVPAPAAADLQEGGHP
ncbi:NADH-quinone oxidoreductase subunit M [Nocardia farcinica]|uniref:NADH-quinone oxidoreductase subunit M n=1 Tax=Nocardia farcinica TaxID=37329 RepID=UPI0018956F9E|nr:NADH-quinone oxidoreductase subunit M [Nocardia farcinica]MBF6249595.1 NADH-quinone oxidoreductase subunit M [Nocardia farcinica]MBF6260916.1 NADH-quinone oxidoreductase subunit M [Nocardia farcinica]MBF6279416.1 NADH-quinone oxidoreductase subunit M [Nocardia farcinica]MBF6303926.1 NADH-quinone oxidoreductase subunit M [Nocardia farcinica]MBF6388968.1 NADH-quinone oxidoreductase subunit M [Nocardia farcinica]